ncbi:hypothetical protein RHMOL_Rhmol11G0170400 [Rhododendron molle]|uniref:Uncharacterized protein n=1 Tax=Rhododendron molle TaxID=49168 RepID=A0ACC0LT38_RHOML|nr:hypothetical protein RHMOL_Rhmol11G0170400 [Rhododendron molle]
MKLWFASAKPWSGEPASLKRFAWVSCQGVPLNVWNAKTFEQIGGLWGYFIKLEVATLKELSFTKGRFLIATEEIQRINRWIQIEVEGVVYDVKVSEESTFVSPDEVEESTGSCFQKLSPVEGVMEMVSKAGKEDDDGVDRPVEKVSNRNEVVGAGRVSFNFGGRRVREG